MALAIPSRVVPCMVAIRPKEEFFAPGCDCLLWQAPVNQSVRTVLSAQIQSPQNRLT